MINNDPLFQWGGYRAAAVILLCFGRVGKSREVTSDEMIFSSRETGHRSHLRFLVGATLLSIGAARAETASTGRIDRGWKIALWQRGIICDMARIRIRVGYGCQQSSRIGMCG